MFIFHFFKEIVMATKEFVVTGDQYRVIDRRMREIKRQLDQEDGSPLDPEWVASELQRVVEGQTMVLGWGGFRVFKTIKLGTGLKTADDFSRALNENGCKVGEWAKDILGKPEFTAALKETEIDLVAILVAELGFKQGATRQDIYERAQELGLALCPAEVGPQLRLQYKDQPKGEWLLIAMDPIAGSHGSPSVFGVAHDDEGLWLYGYYGNPEHDWSADDRWAFARRK